MFCFLEQAWPTRLDSGILLRPADRLLERALQNGPNWDDVAVVHAGLSSFSSPVWRDIRVQAEVQVKARDACKTQRERAPQGSGSEATHEHSRAIRASKPESGDENTDSTLGWKELRMRRRAWAQEAAGHAHGCDGSAITALWLRLFTSFQVRIHFQSFLKSQSVTVSGLKSKTSQCPAGPDVALFHPDAAERSRISNSYS